MEVLDLRDNKLSAESLKTMFPSLKSLKKIYLDNCQLNSLPERYSIRFLRISMMHILYNGSNLFYILYLLYYTALTFYEKLRRLLLAVVNADI